MINLLPEYYRSKLVSVYRFRVAIVLLSGLLVIFILVNIIFVGFWLLVRTERASWLRLEDQSKEQSAIVAKNKQIPANLGDPKNLAEAVKLIKKMNQAALYPTVVFDRVLITKSGSIKIDNLVYTKDKEERVSVNVSGRHLGRQNLVAFVDRLKASRDWSTVDAPLSNFIRESAGEFELALQAGPGRNR